jgi:hypothetical protein
MHTSTFPLMKKSIKDVIDKTWGTGKCDIPSILEVIETSGNSFSKDDVLESSTLCLVNKDFHLLQTN